MHSIVQILTREWQATPVSLKKRLNPEFFKKQVWFYTLTLQKVALFINVKIH